MSIQRVDNDILDQLAEGVLDGGFLDQSAIESNMSTDSPGPGSVTYPDSVKQLAFTMWAFESGRNIRHTREMVKERTGVDVDAQTLRRWRDSQNWNRMLLQVHQSLREKSASQVAALIAVGTVKAARWMVGVFDNPNVKDETKARIAMTLLSRGGFPEMIRGELWSGVNGRESMRDLDDADLDAAIARYLEDGQAETPDPPRELSSHETALQQQHSRIDGAETRNRR